MIVQDKGTQVGWRETVVSLLVVLLAGTALLVAQQTAPFDANHANQLVREMIENELKTNRNQSRWMYRLEQEKGDKTTVTEIIETAACDIGLLLSSSGESLSPDQRQKESQRVEALVNNPAEQRKKRHDEEEDAHKAVELFRMLPEAFLYQYGAGRGSLIELAFRPNPEFHPSSREAQILHAMEGTMWIEAQKKRLVELDGHLAQDVEFGGGLFGRLEKGGHFAVTRAELAPAQWVITKLAVEIKGKALLFKSINVQQKDSMSDFRQVPADLSLARAASILKAPDFADGTRELADRTSVR